MPIKKELNSDWKFKQARLANWYPATVPGVVHMDLIANQIIDDPFFRLNERGVQWIDKEDWIYETTVTIPDEIFSKHNIILYFKGLDTYADVYLNEEKILEANNMFREWKIDIKNKIKKGDNTLQIYFHSPIKVDMPKWEALPFQYESSNDQSENGGIFNRRVSVFARKAGYHYGWDWGPRLVTSGIWRPVYLEAWDDARLQDVFIQQKEVSSQKAIIKASVEIVADKDLPDAVVSIKNNVSQEVFASIKVNLKKGINVANLDFTIKNPHLWWSRGLGEQYRYEMKTEIAANTSVIDSQIDKIGIRSLKVINRPDEHGKTLYIELNGVPVFAKGANYIPCDNFLPRVTKAVYERTLLDAINVNMNTLRVWGGGIYEDDIFYDLCDQYGILVWQDFMFACSVYPAEGEFLENVRHEAIDNIKRLRNHASIALWCGNNECLEAWFGWGWEKKYQSQNPQYAEIIWKQYDTLFNHLLKDVVADYAPESFYWPSSPYYRPEGGTSDKSGDRHYWDVWHGRKPISEYNKERSRFFSEYGFQAFPEFESVKKYAPYSGDWSITSEVMMSHQRGGSHANELIETYLLNEYQKPKDFESFLYMNSVLQGDAIRTAIEAHRRDMPYCMGSLYWQHNDCWPVASWSSRDYYGRWKALHYFARNAFADLLVSPIEKEGTLDVYIVSDRLKKQKGTLSIRIVSLTGETVSSIRQTVTVKANASNKVFSHDLKKLLKGAPRNSVVVNLVFIVGKETFTNNYFLDKQKNIRFPEASVSRSVQVTEGGYEVTLESDCFARAVFLSLEGIDNFFETNYFDILPKEKVTVKVQSNLSPEMFDKQLKIRSLRDSY
ncbi:MAG: glycoside hydrolase family 2 protein [Dysgonamonadaceae bacterium]|nr:glycoside hydrolase family 2 protein [Dysgonamonadaceae bacterium]